MSRRITGHPILPPLPPASVLFTFNDRPVAARPGEMISSALFAAGITTFGHHPRDGGAQSIFCVNGQCSQCTVIVDGAPLKSCMTPAREGMVVRSVEGRPPLPADDRVVPLGRPGEVRVPVLILGGGPAGLCAAIELGRAGIECLVVDDKPVLGGKLSLQTHGFFGSVGACWAGTRGVDIGHTLEHDLAALPQVSTWLQSSAIGVFADGKVGVVTPDGYRLVHPDVLLVALGAREKSLSFPGCDLPGVYGAGAFQTLVNRDLVKPSDRLFVLGGGNVGLIGAYHALQAGIDVVGLVEALPQVGGYKVHADKLRRLGVPIWTSHTVVRADADDTGERLRSVTIAAIDSKFRVIEGTERTFAVDTLLIAVGLTPCDELLVTAKGAGLKVYAAGDTAEIAEASAAIFSGRIAGRQIAQDLGVPVSIPADWPEMARLLRSKPGRTVPFDPRPSADPVHPVIRCVQEIPCDPCRASCPDRLITMSPSIMDLPFYTSGCLGCAKCVTVCPGLAITLVDTTYDPTHRKALLTLPFEFAPSIVPLGASVTTVDINGDPVGTGTVIACRERPEQDRRRLLLLEVPFEERLAVAGFTIRHASAPLARWHGTHVAHEDGDPDDPVVCRCERIRRSAIVAEIREGVRDLNQLKAISRASLGGCGGKTCTELIRRIFREEGIDLGEVTPGTIRPLVAEAPLGAFVAGEGGPRE